MQISESKIDSLITALTNKMDLENWLLEAGIVTAKDCAHSDFEPNAYIAALISFWEENGVLNEKIEKFLPTHGGKREGAGRPITISATKNINIRADVETLELLERLSTARNQTKSEVIREALRVLAK